MLRSSVFPFKTSSYCQSVLPMAPHSIFYITCLLDKLYPVFFSELSSCKWTSREDKAFVLLNEPQEPCWVYFSWVYIRFDFCWFLHFSAFWLSLPVAPVGDDCVLRFSEPECYSCRLFIPVPPLQAVSHLCVLVFTPSHALILQTAVSIFEISFL